MKVVKFIDAGIYVAFAAYLFAHWNWSARYIAGMTIGVIGFVLWMVARQQLGASFSVKAKARALVTTGLYSKFRHPIYYFAGIGYVGLLIAWGKIIPLVCFLVFYSFQLVRALKEESVLEKAFGEEFRRYKATTWI